MINYQSILSNNFLYIKITLRIYFSMYKLQKYKIFNYE